MTAPGPFSVISSARSSAHSRLTVSCHGVVALPGRWREWKYQKSSRSRVDGQNRGKVAEGAAPEEAVFGGHPVPENDLKSCLLMIARVYCG